MARVYGNHIMSLDNQANSICKSAFIDLRNIGSIRNMLTDDASSQLIHSLVIVRIDYCNSLLNSVLDLLCFDCKINTNNIFCNPVV